MQQDRRGNKYPFFLPLIFAYQKSQSGFKVASASLLSVELAPDDAQYIFPHLATLGLYYPPTVLQRYQRYLKFLPPSKADNINPKDICFIEAHSFICLCIFLSLYQYYPSLSLTNGDNCIDT